jgi:hypothetical protein
MHNRRRGYVPLDPAADFALWLGNGYEPPPANPPPPPPSIPAGYTAEEYRAIMPDTNPTGWREARAEKARKDAANGREIAKANSAGNGADPT